MTPLASLRTATWVPGTAAHSWQATAAGVDHKIETYSAAHGYAVPDNRSYDADAAERRWTATREFFGANLHG